jgi:hypothetical protein
MGKALGEEMKACFRMSIDQSEKRCISLPWRPTFETSERLRSTYSFTVTVIEVKKWLIVLYVCFTQSTGSAHMNEWLANLRGRICPNNAWTSGSHWMKEPRYQRTLFAWGEIGTVLDSGPQQSERIYVGLKLGGARFRFRSGHIICTGKWGAPNRRHFFVFISPANKYRL